GRQHVRAGAIAADRGDGQDSLSRGRRSGFHGPSRRDARVGGEPQRQQILRRTMVIPTCPRRRRAAARKTQALARRQMTWIRGKIRGAVALAFALATMLPAPFAVAQPQKLAVCADPNNLPFSNRAEEGFENRLAEIWARELGIDVEHTWFPHRRAFERNTLNAQDPS